MKKKIIICSIVLLLIVLLVLNRISHSKFYLDDKYYNINYNTNSFIEIDKTKISELNKDSYLLFTYNNYCSLPIPCEYIFEDFMSKYNISIVSIPFKEFKETKYYKKVKYAPTIIIIKEGNIVAYLDANSEKDLDKYQNIEEFVSWISKYIYLNQR